MTKKSTTKRLLLSGLSVLALAGTSLAQTANPVIEAQGFTYIGSFQDGNNQPYHDYYLTNTTGSWTDMEAKAQTIGAHLIAINSAAENNIVTGIDPKLLALDQLAWIGMNKEGNVWHWSNGDAYDIADPTYYQNWVSGMPDNWAGTQNYACIHSDVSVADRPFAKWDDAQNFDVPGYDVKNSFKGIVEFVPCSFNVTFNLPALPFKGGGDVNFGIGAQQITIDATTAGGKSYKWIGPSASLLSKTDTASPAFAPASTGAYKFTVVVTGQGCASVAETRNITVTDPRDGTSGKVWICQGSNGSKSFAPDAATNQLKNNPSYTLGKCGSTLRREVLAAESAEVKVYPNPAQSAFYVVVPQTEEVATVTVLDMQGKVVDNRKLGANDNRQVRFDFANSPRGLYIVEVSYGQERFHSKIVLQ